MPFFSVVISRGVNILAKRQTQALEEISRKGSVIKVRKKRIVIIVAIILAVILLFPIPLWYKDGGSVEFRSIVNLYSIEKWDACAHPVDPDTLRGRPCYAGLDLSSTTDITAFVLVFPPMDAEDRYEVLPFFWLPEDTLPQRVRRDHVQYDVWAARGKLKTTEGNVVHYGFIEKAIEELGEVYNIREIAYDDWNATHMIQNLEGLGFRVVPFGQGFKSMSPPSKELMRLTLDGKIAHGGHPVLRWMMDNIFVRTDPAGNIKPDKEKSSEKIDGAVALIMGLDRATRGGGHTESVYSKSGRGLLVL